LRNLVQSLWHYLTRFDVPFPAVRIFGRDEHHGEVYLTRFFLTPVTRWGAVYLHCFHREDLDRDPHDHPFNFWTIPLGRAYVEEVFEHVSNCLHEVTVPAWRVSLRPARHRHRILRPLKGGWPLWTLVFRGSNVRKWGFWTHADERSTKRGFVPWKEYCYGDGGNANVQGVDASCPGLVGSYVRHAMLADEELRDTPSRKGEQFIFGPGDANV
jgi:hypothetical protein